MMQFFMRFRMLFDHQKRDRLGGELLADELSDPAEPADNIMILQGIDPLLHFLPPDNPLNLAFKHDLGKAADDVTENAYPENYQDNGEYLAVMLRS